MSSTPILERQVPMPPVHSGRPVGLMGAAPVLLLGMISTVVLLMLSPRAGAFLGARIQEWHQVLFPEELTLARSLSVGIMLLATVLLAVMIHEGGHLLGGLCAGFRFSQLRIGPLHLDRPFRISFRRSPGSGYFGWVSMFPGRRDRLRARAALLVLGGPGINLACAACLAAWFEPKSFFTWSFLLVSLALGVKELLPLRHRVAVSDGRRLWILFRDPLASRRWLALMKLGADFRTGVLPEAMSEESLADALAPSDASADTVIANLFGYVSAFHRQDDVEAARLLETSLQHSSSAAPSLRHALMSDAAVFLARRRRRPDLAEQWLADMPQSSDPRWLRTRAEAAILEARGDSRGSLAKLDELERDYRVLPDRAAANLLLQLLERWRAELRTQAAGRS